MSYEILFIQGAGEVTVKEEQVIVDALQEHLGDDYHITLPVMPEADEPRYAAWDKVLTEHLNQLSGKVILLGHSLGASFILKHFSKEPVPDKVVGMLLFGVPYWKDQDWDVSDYEIADGDLKNLKELDRIYFYHSMDDEVIPYEHFKAYRKLIPKPRWRVLSGVDHSYHGAIANIVEDIRDLTLNSRG